MTNLFIRLSVIATALFFLIFSISGCERIDAGHVGVKVNLYGDGKGVDDVTEVTGWVLYNPISTKIVEFPTFVQHKEYKQVIEDGQLVADESFVVNSKDGSEFHVSPLLNYSVKREKVPYIFSKYRVTLDNIEEGFLKTAVYDAFRVVANSYTADALISNRQDFEAKNNAVQSALTAENKVKQAEAEAKIKVATAEGNAQALLTNARAEAESNRLRQQTLTPMLLQQKAIEKWNGVLPQYQMGGGSNFYLPIK
jgi:regulator of protease activity HflC (stomatin/prohibitin superfamily)